ncbi:MAG: histidine--tRNA ligase [Nanoarchaeota archaeon]|nr:histidine--tRNA ligase [Nanoarchaeota archaeon]
MADFSLPRGVQYLVGETVEIKESVVSIIKEGFSNFGFQSFKSPALYNQDSLSFKSGDAILKEIYAFEIKGHKLGLKFDQTVPLAIYLAMNPNQKLPFKRMEFGPAWRWGDVKEGRYREFEQFDIDIVGIVNMSADAEILSVASKTISKLGLKNHVINLNNRKLLDNIIEYSGALENYSTDYMHKEIQKNVIQSLDKLDKIGLESVKSELLAKDIEQNSIDRLIEVINIKGKTNDSKLKNLESILGESKGLVEINELLDYVKAHRISNKINFNPSVARGLDYYTGPVFETIITGQESLGSVCSGGRYDDMIGQYIGNSNDIPATGISIGVSRIIQAIKNENVGSSFSRKKVYVANIGENLYFEATNIANKLRSKNIFTEINLKPELKLSKQLDLANKLGYKTVVIIGKRELENNSVEIKNFSEKDPNKKQITAKISELHKFL